MKSSDSNNYTNNPVDFTIVFESMPGYNLLLGIDAPLYTILAISNEFLKPLNKKRASIIGNGFFEVFIPEPVDSKMAEAVNLSASFATLISSKLAQQIPAKRFVITNNEGHYKEYDWSVTNKPVLDGKGNVLYMLLSVENVTSNISALQPVAIIKEMEQAHNLLMQTPAAVAILKGPELIVELANDPIKKIWAKGNDLEGKPITQILPELKSQGLFEIMHEVRTTGIPYHAYEMQVNFIKAGKEVISYFNFIYQPYLENKSTSPAGIIIFALDVTESVLSKKVLEESEVRFNQITNTLPLVVWTASPDGALTYISNQWEDVYGNPIAESLGSGWAKFVHPDDVEHAAGTWARVLKSGQPYETEFRVHHKNGDYHWQLVRALPILNNNGMIVSWYGSNTDIQDKKLAENALRESELQVLSIVESAPFPIAVYTGKEMRIVLANQTILNTWGKGNGVIGKLFSEVLPELENTQIFKELDTVYNSGMAFHAKNQRVDLVINNKLLPHYFNYSFTPLFDSAGKVYGVMNTAANVTDLALAKQKVEESERNLHNTILQAPVAMCILRGSTYIVEIANSRMLQIWGTAMDQVLHKPIFEGLPEAKGQGLEELLEKVYTTGETFRADGLPVKLPRNGKMEIRYLNFVYEAFKEADQSISGIMAVAVDVTEQLQAKNEIEKSELQFRNLAQALPQLVWVTDHKGQNEFASKRWEDFTGVKPNGEKEWEAIVHKDDLENINNTWMHSLTTGNIYKSEVRIKSKSGDYIWHSVNGEPVYDNDNNITKWVGAFTEIHHIKEEEQRKDDFIKMVSHELKTPVTSIKGYVQLLLMILKSDAAVNFPAQFKSSLVRIDAQIIKLTRLIAEMLDLNRIEANSLELKKELFSINLLVKEVMEDILNTHPNHTINLHEHVNCNVYADRDRIGQVIINFITNAIKYSPGKNQIDIQISGKADNHVSVTVKDYGIGIDKSQHQKVFERFYRVDGKSEQTYPGFGIGLFIANSIIQRHNGFINIESEKGKGTQFTFVLATIP